VIWAGGGEVLPRYHSGVGTMEAELPPILRNVPIDVACQLSDRCVSLYCESEQFPSRSYWTHLLQHRH